MKKNKVLYIAISLVVVGSVAAYWLLKPMTARQLAISALVACENDNADRLLALVPDYEKKAYNLTLEKLQHLLALVKMESASGNPSKYIIAEQPSTGGCSASKWFATNNNQISMFSTNAELHSGFRAELSYPVTELLAFYVVNSGATSESSDKHLKFVNGIRNTSRELSRIGFEGLLQMDGTMLKWNELEDLHLKRSEVYKQRKRALAEGSVLP
jgi:hypothetical protein